MRNNSGFTLIELILVTIIIGILAGMVVVNFAGFQTDARINAAKGDIANYSTAIDLYALKNNDKYPGTLQDLITGKRKYVKELRDDTWGTPYIYDPPTNPLDGDYVVFSAGPDGQPGTADDVTSTSKHGDMAEEAP